MVLMQVLFVGVDKLNLDKCKISLLNKKVFGGRRWYQYFNFGDGVDNRRYVGERGVYRTKSYIDFLNSLEFSKDETVLDIGCNAGLFCYELSGKVSKVIGVEISKGFVKQSNFLRRKLLKQGRDLSNVDIRCEDITKNLDLFTDVNTVLMSKVIYHKNMHGLGEKVLKAISDAGVSRILVQGHVTQGAMGEDAHIQDLLVSYGYVTSSIDQHEEYPIAVAVREG